MTHRSIVPDANIFQSLYSMENTTDEIFTQATKHIPGVYAGSLDINAPWGLATLPSDDMFGIYSETSLFNKELSEWSEFKSLCRLRGTSPLEGTKPSDVAEDNSGTLRANSFIAENMIENTMGNDLNRLLGNIITQPYVKITDIPESENPSYWDNMSVDVYSEIGGSNVDSNGDPCAPEYTKTTINASDFADIFNSINSKRDEDNNIFRSYMREYIPISAWSHFYNTIFLKTIFSYESSEYGNVNKPIVELYKKYGFKLIFKNFKFGLRLTYTIPTETFDNTSGDEISIRDIMEDSFTGEDNIKGLKACKTLYVQRPYFYEGGKTKRILSELHIPIVEVEKELIMKEGTNGFIINNDEKLHGLDDLGFWSEGPELWQSAFDRDINELISTNTDMLKYITNSPHTFFYKNLAQDLMKDLKSSAEFKILYDYAFPIDNYMALGFLYAADGLSTFIPEPTNVLDETKEKILMIMKSLMNSQDFSFVPDDVLSTLGDVGLRNLGGTTGQEPDMTKLIMKIIYKTMFMILKGFVEITDPAIIIAKTVIDISNAVVMTTLSIIKQGLQMAKTILLGSKIAAQAALQNALLQLQIAAGIVESVSKSSPISVNFDVAGHENPDDMSITIDDVDDDGDIEPGSELEAAYNNLDSGQQQDVDNILESFLKVKTLFEGYAGAHKTLEDINAQLEGAINDLEVFRADAEETMQEVFNSPYLLPGLWAAMVPSMTPYGGGIIPPPFFLGPPSTIPGMIYLALLLIDAMDDKKHDDVNEDPDCDNQL